nr:MAG TPA: AAA-ATPase Vps4-associated protein 1 [Caudoviricetes sp.]
MGRGHFYPPVPPAGRATQGFVTWWYRWYSKNSDFLYKVCFAHLADGGIRCGLAHSPEQQRVLRDFCKIQCTRA